MNHPESFSGPDDWGDHIDWEALERQEQEEADEWARENDDGYGGMIHAHYQDFLGGNPGSSSSWESREDWIEYMLDNYDPADGPWDDDDY